MTCPTPPLALGLAALLALPQLAVLLTLPQRAAAQAPPQATQRPSDVRPELPDIPDVEPAPPALQLPPIPPPSERDRGDLARGRGIHVERFDVRGSSVFDAEQLAAVVAPYQGRELGPEELAHVRNALTRLYVDAGYITSGARIPDQAVRDGTVAIEVVEGELAELSLEGLERLRDGYVRARLERAAGAPVNVFALEEQLQLLRQDGLVEQINAELLPGRRRGESALVVALREATPFVAVASASNEEAPSVGSEGGGLYLAHRNLTGRGDRLSAFGRLTEGFDDLELTYSLPLNAADTTLELFYRRSRSEIVENPFDELDIESEAQSYGVTLRHPVLRDRRRELWLGLTGEYRRSETDYIFGDFPFTPGSEDGEVKLALLRFVQDFARRAPRQVLAVRSTATLGIGALNSTRNGSGEPDGRFLSWLGQLQYARRLDRLGGTQLVFRTDVQLASKPLLSLEQFALGGLRSVRGYRENELVRDNGWVSSLELRIPVLRDEVGNPRLQVIPFFDTGKAWNKGPDRGPQSLASLGLGLRYEPTPGIAAEVYWGGRLRHISRRGNDIQNNGFHFRVQVALW